MLFLSAVLPLLALTGAAAAHDRAPPHLRHRRLAHEVAARQAPKEAHIARSNEAHAQAVRVIKRKVRQRGQTCRPRNPQASATASASAAGASSASGAAPTADVADSHAYVAHGRVGHSSSSASAAAYSSAAHHHSQAPAPSPPAPSPSPPPPAPPPPQPDTAGTYGTNDNRCGWSNASPENPNGSEDWLNCGVEGGGWTPPFLGLHDIKAADLSADGVFAPCAQYFWAFQQYGGEFGSKPFPSSASAERMGSPLGVGIVNMSDPLVPPIMLASFAMQESTCNPSVTGGGGEAGMMQIAPPNCEAGNNCWDINYNVRRGAQLFRGKIDAAGGNVVQAIGAYNGWQPGMTVGSAMAAKWSGSESFITV